jgi:hypothetical protein
MYKALGSTSSNTKERREIENLNRLIICNEVEVVIRSPILEESPRPDGFIIDFYQVFRGHLIPILFKFLAKNWKMK